MTCRILAAVDKINAGLIESLGWEAFDMGNGTYQSPFANLAELSAFLKSHFESSTIRVVGDPKMAVKSIAILPGAHGREAQVQAYNGAGVDVLIVGEAREWETIEYVRDAMEMGKKTALIVMGHADSEEPGMDYVANWLKPLIPEVPVQFIPAGNPLWGTD